MCTFTYIEKDEKFYMVIGERLKVRWLERWIPASATVTILPSSVKLSKSSYTLDEEQTYTLTATVSPETTTDKTVVWSSSDETIATVSDVGKVTAVKVGECSITATCIANSSAKASCAIRVRGKE